MMIVSEVKTVGKHTPGEWLLDGTTIYVLNNENIPVNRFTAQLDRGWSDEGKRISQDEIIANARIISAAPELLEALELLFDDYKQLADSGDAGFWRLEDKEAGRRAIAAIAKARGIAK